LQDFFELSTTPA